MEVKPKNFRQIILDFPKQFSVGLEIAKNIKIRGNFIKYEIVICGVGGSALPGELLKLINDNYLHQKIKISINRNYNLPHFVSNNNLIVFISYSGNTEETLSSFKSALRKKLPIAVITSGGELLKICKKKRIPLAIVPANIPPRMATGYQLAALIKILENAKIIKNIEKEILDIEKNLKPLNFEKQGRDLADKLFGKIPLIYTTQSYKTLAYIWKIKFNENSKIPAFYNYFPELNHNEMSGFQNLQGKFRIISMENDESAENSKRIKLTATSLKQKGVETDIVAIKGKNIFDKIFSNIILSDWTSYYLAKKYKIDPFSTKMIEEFKKKLKKIK